jgi:rfaE bifunctional protein nucleotidyltransferase chain/domain
MSQRIAVVGDALLDVDVVGSVTRTTPDAPALVLEQQARLSRPGGAGLAAWLAASHAVEVSLACPLADDAAGGELAALVSERVSLVALPDDGATSVKTRSRADGHTLLRTDVPGRSHPVSSPDLLASALEGADVVLVSDYGRGFTSLPWVRAALADVAHRVPLVWDPHPRGADPVPGSRVVTPNLAEVGAAVDSAVPVARSERLAWAGRSAAALVSRWQVGSVAVTLGTDGALLSYGDPTPIVLPLGRPPIVATDPCGAGDSFAASVAVALARGAVIPEAVEQAVADAADFVAAGGAAAVAAARLPSGDGSADPGDVTTRRSSAQDTDDDVVVLLDRVRAAGGTGVATGGCVDLVHAGHVQTLRAARALGDCLVVLVNSDESVRRLKGPSRPLVPVADRARVLAALDCVDAVVVFDEDTPEQALSRIRPDVWAKGGDYAAEDLPECRVLEQWGGHAVLLPYVAGRSTSRMLETALNRRSG